MQDDLTLAAYHYDLPEKNIAQQPTEKRELSRLMLLNRDTGNISHLQFSDISALFNPGDVLVVNNTKVFKARLQGRKETGGKTEVFLLSYPVPEKGTDTEPGGQTFICEALIKSSRKPQRGSIISIDNNCRCILLKNTDRGKWLIRLLVSEESSLELVISTNGAIPLPPYISRPKGASSKDVSRYQTVYADRVGAVAAPTAGLHFTEELLENLMQRDIAIAPVTLHVGYGTFSPVEKTNIKNHAIHREQIEISKKSADLINNAKKDGRAVWAVGTTSARTLEYCSDTAGHVSPFSGWCDLYIYPGYTFRTVDNLITNFHLPQSSLMFLVSALCGRELLLDCYRRAVNADYRFFSYGDAMAIIRGGKPLQRPSAEQTTDHL